MKEKIAIISDIHGCYLSLEAVLNDIEKRGITRIFCLGDLVAKGSQPDKVIDKVKECCEVVLKGNCDDIVAEFGTTDEHFWNKEIIGSKRQEYLKNLPYSYEFKFSGLNVRLLHASPDDMYQSINVYDITEDINSEIDNMFKNSAYTSDITPDVVIFGHIHSPFMHRVGNRMLVSAGSVSNCCDIIMKNNEKYLMSTYLIIEGEEDTQEVGEISYKYVRVPYDYTKEIDNLKRSNMPNKEMAIEELETGIYVKR